MCKLIDDDRLCITVLTIDKFEVINECESANLNDCDRHAECIDLQGGYECRCKEPYHDESPVGQPGRICRFNECSILTGNTCDKKFAICEDLDDGYTCHCKAGYYDNSPNTQEPGRVCIGTLNFRIKFLVFQIVNPILLK